jgi:hypothetical protein
MILTPKQHAIVQAKVDAHNTANPEEQLTVESMLDGIAMRQVAVWEAEDLAARRAAMIPVADEILAASPEKQAAAIQAALNEIRS